jgi:hypothetical protein
LSSSTNAKNKKECKVTNTPMNYKEKLSKENCTQKVDEGHFKNLISCIMYLSTIRSDILFVLSLLFWFMYYVSEMHLKEAKRTLRYIKGSVNYGVKFEKCQSFKLYRFSNSDWVGSIDDIRSTS